MSALLVLWMLFQTTNASISGTVTDPTGASVPAARVQAENVKTGVVMTTISNEAGVYQFPSVQPGTYRLAADPAGFRKHVFNDVVVDVSARLTINFPVEIANVSESLEVTAAESPLLTGTASVDGVITGKRIQELPLPDRDALGLVLTQPGLLGDNFAGSRIGALNVTRDGINVMDQRVNLGVNAVIFESVDTVDEVRVVTSPVDAELGRGSGQVQILTRSGTNQFHGSVFEQHRNTALNANDWFNNLYGIPRDALILNQFGGRLGGPIVHNRTFFHFSYEGWRERTADLINATTYTQAARQGIFRFFPGVENSNTNGTVPTVDPQGNPIKPAGATGDLQSINLFGRDSNREGLDPTGTIQKFLKVMPLPNNFRIGDGLNTAGYQWRQRGTNDLNQYNLRLDHNFSSSERLTFSLTKEDQGLLNGFMGQTFPASPGGSLNANGKFYSLALSSTLSPTQENEFHAGAQRYRLRFNAPWELPGGRTLLPAASGRQFGGIFNVFSGEPIGMFTNTTAFNQLADTAVLTGGLPKTIGTVTRTGDGVVYFNNLKQMEDPSVQNLTSLQSLGSSSTMKGITDSSGTLLLVNPTPGQLGNISPSYLQGPGAFRFDVNLLKKIRLPEQREVEFRIDAINVLNTPQFGNPETNINSTNFGRITSASGSRIFALQVRLSF